MSGSSEIIVAAYDTPAHAELAVQDLLAAGVDENEIVRHLATSSGDETPPRSFWERLLGGHAAEGPANGRMLYDRTIGGGGTLVTVLASASDVGAPDGDRIATILAEHAPVDLDDRLARHVAAPLADPVPLLGLPGAGIDASIAADAVNAVAIGRVSQLLAERSLVERGDSRVRRYVEPERR